MKIGYIINKLEFWLKFIKFGFLPTITEIDLSSIKEDDFDISEILTSDYPPRNINYFRKLIKTGLENWWITGQTDENKNELFKLITCLEERIKPVEITLVLSCLDRWLEINKEQEKVLTINSLKDEEKIIIKDKNPDNLDQLSYEKLRQHLLFILSFDRPLKEYLNVVFINKSKTEKVVKQILYIHYLLDIGCEKGLICHNNEPLTYLSKVDIINSRINWLENLLKGNRDKTKYLETSLNISILNSPIRIFKKENVWKKTFNSKIYQEYLKKLLEEKKVKELKDLRDLSAFNIENLKTELGNTIKYLKEEISQVRIITKEEGCIVSRFINNIFFKHSSNSIPIMLNMNAIVKPERSGAGGVSKENEDFDHNNYVFGRFELFDGYVISRFGKESLSIPFSELGNDVSISLHDQSRPFDKGHTTEIKFNDTCIRSIPINDDGKKAGKVRQWTQQYGGGTLIIENSFVREVFVGMNDSRLGIALSIILELRRMAGVGVENQSDNKVFKAGAEYRKFVLGVFKNNDKEKLGNILKTIFRIEIRVPEYLDLTGKKFSHYENIFTDNNGSILSNTPKLLQKISDNRKLLEFNFPVKPDIKNSCLLTKNYLAEINCFPDIMNDFLELLGQCNLTRTGTENLNKTFIFINDDKTKLINNKTVKASIKSLFKFYETLISVEVQYNLCKKWVTGLEDEKAKNEYPGFINRIMKLDNADNFNNMYAELNKMPLYEKGLCGSIEKLLTMKIQQKLLEKILAIFN